MRFLRTGLLGAVFLFVAWMVIAGIASYWGAQLVPHEVVPSSWQPPKSWNEWRDIVLVLTAFFWLIAGIVMVALTVALLFLVLLLRRVIKENAVPAIDSLKDSLDNVRGTTEFAGETIASPIIRVYSVVKGVRSGVGAVTNLPSRIRGQKRKGRRW
ncbi:MAG: hypothetical protein ACRDG3_02540 [Tepidiformaceae bacterium]